MSKRKWITGTPASGLITWVCPGFGCDSLTWGKKEFPEERQCQCGAAYTVLRLQDNRLLIEVNK